MGSTDRQDLGTECVGQGLPGRPGSQGLQRGSRLAARLAGAPARGGHGGRGWEGAEARRWVRPSEASALATLPGSESDAGPWGTEGMTGAMLLFSIFPPKAE